MRERRLTSEATRADDAQHRGEEDWKFKKPFQNGLEESDISLKISIKKGCMETTDKTMDDDEYTIGCYIKSFNP